MIAVAEAGYLIVRDATGPLGFSLNPVVRQGFWQHSQPLAWALGLTVGAFLIAGIWLAAVYIDDLKLARWGSVAKGTILSKKVGERGLLLIGLAIESLLDSNLTDPSDMPEGVAIIYRYHFIDGDGRLIEAKERNPAFGAALEPIVIYDPRNSSLCRLYGALVAVPYLNSDKR